MSSRELFDQYERLEQRQRKWSTVFVVAAWPSYAILLVLHAIYYGLRVDHTFWRISYSCAVISGSVFILGFVSILMLQKITKNISRKNIPLYGSNTDYNNRTKDIEPDDIHNAVDDDDEGEGTNRVFHDTFRAEDDGSKPTLLLSHTLSAQQQVPEIFPTPENSSYIQRNKKYRIIWVSVFIICSFVLGGCSFTTTLLWLRQQQGDIYQWILSDRVHLVYVFQLFVQIVILWFITIVKTFLTMSIYPSVISSAP